MIEEYFRHAGLSTTIGMGLQLLSVLAGFVGIVGLRFMRRGAARFAVSPGMVSLALAPTALGAATAILGFRNTLQGMASTGAGGVAALAAGSYESLIPLFVGLLFGTALAGLALLITAGGTSRAPADAPGRGAVLPLVTLLVGTLAGVLVLLVTITVVAPNAGVLDPGALLLMVRLSLVGALALVVFLLVWVVATSVRVPRGAVTLPGKVVSLLALLGAAVGSLTAAWIVFGQVGALSQTALTGQPYDHAFGSVVRAVAVRLGARVEPRPIVVSVSVGGGYAVDGEPVAAAALGGRLSVSRGEGGDLVLSAGPEVSYARVSSLIDAAAQAGWEHLQLRRGGRAVVVGLPHLVSGRASGPAPILVRVGSGDLEINQTPLRDADQLETLLRDVLSTRVSKLVFVWPRDDAPHETWANAVEAMQNAGAETVLMTPKSVESFPSIPPPPPPPTPVR